MARIWVLRAVVIRLDGRQFPSSQQQHSLGVPGAWSRCRTPHGLSGCLGQRNFASGPLAFAVKGLVHVNVLHGQEEGIRNAENFQILVTGRYLIVLLLGCLM